MSAVAHEAVYLPCTTSCPSWMKCPNPPDGPPRAQPPHKLPSALPAAPAADAAAGVAGGGVTAAALSPWDDSMVAVAGPGGARLVRFTAAADAAAPSAGSGPAPAAGAAGGGAQRVLMHLTAAQLVGRPS